MKVYLDNNLIVGIENGEFDLISFKTIADVEYFYSAAHIDELIEGEHLQKLSVEKRLLTIEQLAGINHILNGTQTPEFYPKSAKEIYDISHTPWAMKLRASMNVCLNAFNPDREKFMEILKLNKIEVNNIKPCEIINEIDKRLQQADNYDDNIKCNVEGEYDINTINIDIDNFYYEIKNINYFKNLIINHEFNQSYQKDYSIYNKNLC